VFIHIHPRSLERFRDKVREITARNRGVKAYCVIRQLSAYLKGWGGHYAQTARCREVFTELDGWCRRRVRQFYWVQWKTSANRYRQLVKGKVNPKKAKSICLSTGKWGPSNSEALKICLTKERLAKAGLVSLANLTTRPQAK
jgi:RNA-directed DNA polymerase